MRYYCDICDITMKLKSKNKHSKSIIHEELEKSFRIVYYIDNPKFFDVDDIYSEFINLHNKKYYLYYMKCNFNLVFENNFHPCIESDLYPNKIICYWKKFLMNATQNFINQGYKFSHISNMNIITINNRRNMTYKYYINQPMSMLADE